VTGIHVGFVFVFFYLLFLLLFCFLRGLIIGLDSWSQAGSYRIPVIWTSG
jgi:hypothetical protein